MIEALLHLLFGFAFFLKRNLARMNFNPDTLVPGLIAYGIVVLLLHWQLRRLCESRGSHWSLLSSCLVALLLPALFGISFLVPGILLQLRELAAGR